jgi:pyruvate dehydrogenase E1 component
MPDFWEFPTVSMGLGPINAIYQARFNRYLHNRGIKDTVQSARVGFLGDGEMDEPESLGAISLAAREELDNLTFVVNCNLQRLDGPVRGNGKIIQELEAVFRGAGWNVIKVIWGREWDELLARDVDGVLVNKMNTTVDGEFQTYSVETAPTSASTSSAPTRGCARWSSTSPTTSSQAAPRRPRLPQGLRRLQGATEHVGAADGDPRQDHQGLDARPGVEGRNATHQIKKLTKDELKIFRDRLYLPDEIPDAALDDADTAAVLPPRPRTPRDPVHDRAPRPSAARCPSASCAAKPLELPGDARYDELKRARASSRSSTTMAFVRLLRT